MCGDLCSVRCDGKRSCEPFEASLWLEHVRPKAVHCAFGSCRLEAAPAAARRLSGRVGRVALILARVATLGLVEAAATLSPCALAVVDAFALEARGDGVPKYRAVMQLCVRLRGRGRGRASPSGVDGCCARHSAGAAPGRCGLAAALLGKAAGWQRQVCARLRTCVRGHRYR